MLTIGTEIIAFLMLYFHANNLIIYHLYSVIEFTLLSMIYYYLVEKAIYKKLIIIGIILFVSTSIVLHILGIETFDKMDANVALLECFILGSFATVFLMTKRIGGITTNAVFWFNTAILLYFAITIPYYFVRIVDLHLSLEFVEVVSLANLVANILQSLLLANAVRCLKYQ